MILSAEELHDLDDRVRAAEAALELVRASIRAVWRAYLAEPLDADTAPYQATLLELQGDRWHLRTQVVELRLKYRRAFQRLYGRKP